jgi:hypothetical protein
MSWDRVLFIWLMAKLVVKLMFDAAVVELDWSLCRAVQGLAGLSIVQTASILFDLLIISSIQSCLEFTTNYIKGLCSQMQLRVSLICTAGILQAATPCSNSSDKYHIYSTTARHQHWLIQAQIEIDN